MATFWWRFYEIICYSFRDIEVWSFNFGSYWAFNAWTDLAQKLIFASPHQRLSAYQVWLNLEQQFLLKGDYKMCELLFEEKVIHNIVASDDKRIQPYIWLFMMNMMILAIIHERSQKLFNSKPSLDLLYTGPACQCHNLLYYVACEACNTCFPCRKFTRLALGIIRCLVNWEMKYIEMANCFKETIRRYLLLNMLMQARGVLTSCMA